MAGLIKAQAGSLAAALGLATLPVHDRQTRRIPVLGAVRLAADGDGLSVTATSFDGTITIEAEAEAEGEVAVPLERLAALVRLFSRRCRSYHHRRRPRGHGHLRQGPVQVAGVSDRRPARAACARR